MQDQQADAVISDTSHMCWLPLAVVHWSKTVHHQHPVGLAVWHSGSVVRRMNEVALRLARLVLGWVTVFGRVCHLGINQAN